MTDYQHKKKPQSSLGYQMFQEQAHMIFWELPTLHCRAEYLQIGGKRKYSQMREQVMRGKNQRLQTRTEKRILLTVI